MKYLLGIFVLAATTIISTKPGLTEELTSAQQYAAKTGIYHRLMQSNHSRLLKKGRTTARASSFSGTWRGTAYLAINGCRLNNVPNSFRFSHRVRHSGGFLSLVNERNIYYPGTSIKNTSFTATKRLTNDSCVGRAGYIYTQINGRRAKVSPGMRIDCRDGSWCTTFHLGNGSR